MATVDELTVRISADIKDLQRQLKNAENSIQRTDKETTKATQSMSSGFSRLKASAAAVAVVLGGMAVREIVQTAASFEKLEASLVTVTGSSLEAEEALSMIQALASTTPFSVQELTQSFIKLKALGLQPSAEALTAYGNTAAAMGKDLNQMIEAIADATTGEFERLKEFGIKARSEGDQVSFTFQGVTQTIGKNAAEIEEYLRSIGQVQFAGAMADQMDTLNGSFSNLGDNVDRLFVAIGEAGLSQATKTATGFLSNMAAVVAENIEEMGILEGVIVGLVQAVEGVGASKAYSTAEKGVLSLGTSIDVTQERLSAMEEQLARLEAIPGISPELISPLRNEAEAARASLDALKKAQEELRTGGPAAAAAVPVAPGATVEEVRTKEAEINEVLAGFESGRIDMFIAANERERELREAKAAEDSAAREAELEELTAYYNEIYNMQTGTWQASFDFVQAIRDKDLKGMLRHGSVMLSNLSQQSRGMFEIQKAFALANAAVTLPDAILQSFRNGGGYPLGLIPAGLMAAQGASQIAAINSASFGGGGNIPSVGGGGGTPVTPTTGPAALPTQTAGITGAAGTVEPSREVRVVVEGDGPHSDGMRKFAKNLGETLDDMGTDIKLVLA